MSTSEWEGQKVKVPRKALNDLSIYSKHAFRARKGPICNGDCKEVTVEPANRMDGVPGGRDGETETVPAR